MEEHLFTLRRRLASAWWDIAIDRVDYASRDDPAAGSSRYVWAAAAVGGPGERHGTARYATAAAALTAAEAALGGA